MRPSHPTRPLGAGAALLAVALVAACGTDVNLSLRLASGTVAESARCRGAGGEFPLRQDDGLTVVIVVSDDTTIVRADFSTGSCGDIAGGDRATVRGSDDGSRIRADRVELADS